MRREMLHFADAHKLTRPTAFTTMIKPVGSLCNLDCDYCYYLGKADLYGGRQPKMSEELLERYIILSYYICHTCGPSGSHQRRKKG